MCRACICQCHSCSLSLNNHRTKRKAAGCREPKGRDDCSTLQLFFLSLSLRRVSVVSDRSRIKEKLKKALECDLRKHRSVSQLVPRVPPRRVFFKCPLPGIWQCLYWLFRCMDRPLIHKHTQTRRCSSLSFQVSGFSKKETAFYFALHLFPSILLFPTNAARWHGWHFPRCHCIMKLTYCICLL